MNIPAIETRGLQKQYEGVLAVSGLDLRVERGEIFGLVGADGAGKTSTIRMLCTLNPPTAGEARILGMDTVDQSAHIKEKIGYMSERFNLYLTLTVAENLNFFARLHNIPPEISERRQKELLSFCRLEPFHNRQAEHLSGGMQKKLALACSLIHQPEVIFLDEPTTGVDPVSRRDFWRIISGFLSRGITILVSTPYLDEAERFSRVAFMHRGKIIACDTPQNLKSAFTGKMLEVRARPVNKAVVVLKQLPLPGTPQVFGDTIHITVDEAEKRRFEIERRLKQQGIAVDDIRRIAASLEDVFVTRLAELEETAPGHTVSNNLANTHATSNSADDITVEVADLTRKFGNFTAVDRVNFSVKRGEIFGLLGPNGSGKTTTIRMITGLLEPTAGSARVMAYDMARDTDAAQSRIGYMSQKFSLFTDLTVDENIRFYSGLYGLSNSLREERKEWVLKMAGLLGKEKAMTRELSGGWKQRLALGCTIMHSPEVVFLDEPTAGVDPLSRRFFWELIQELAARGTTIFITTHYMDEAEHCHRLGLMYQGQLIANGSPHQLKNQQVHGELVEVVTADFARTLEVLSADTRYHRVSLFGNSIHVNVDTAETASREIRSLLVARNVTVHHISHIPFSMEDVFIALIEAQELSLVSQSNEKGA